MPLLVLIRRRTSRVDASVAAVYVFVVLEACGIAWALLHFARN